MLVIDYGVDSYPVDTESPVAPDLPTSRPRRGPLDGPGTQDITVDVAIDQLARSARRTRSPASHWLRAHGIDELVEQGRRIWHEKAAAPDVAALTARSRIGEAEALCDPGGLGAFRVLEWDVAS